MAKRAYMIEYRRQKGITRNGMARICELSEGLIEMLEENEYDVTHPKIAERLGKAYEMTPEQTEGLMPENYRKSSPNYDPDKYRTEGVK